MRQIRAEQACGALSNLAVKQQLLQKLLKLLTDWFVLVCSMTECFPVGSTFNYTVFILFFLIPQFRFNNIQEKSGDYFCGSFRKM